jgi:hypothetical protein
MLRCSAAKPQTGRLIETLGATACIERLHDVHHFSAGNNHVRHLEDVALLLPRLGHSCIFPPNIRRQWSLSPSKGCTRSEFLANPMRTPEDLARWHC